MCKTGAQPWHHTSGDLPHGEDHIGQVKLRQGKCQLVSNWYYSWVQAIMAPGWEGAERSIVPALPKGLNIFHSTLIYPYKHFLLGSTVFQALNRMGGATLTVQGWTAHTGIQVSNSPTPTPATRRSGRECQKNWIRWTAEGGKKMEHAHSRNICEEDRSTGWTRSRQG